MIDQRVSPEVFSAASLPFAVIAMVTIFNASNRFYREADQKKNPSLRSKVPIVIRKSDRSVKNELFEHIQPESAAVPLVPYARSFPVGPDAPIVQESQDA